MTTERFSLDTNVLVDAADLDAGVRHERALPYRPRIHCRWPLQLVGCALMATVARHGCEILLSEDMQDGSQLGGLTVLDPFVGDGLPGRVAELLG
jgi:predicted nucleic acid-binding protein